MSSNKYKTFDIDYFQTDGSTSFAAATTYSGSYTYNSDFYKDPDSENFTAALKKSLEKRKQKEQKHPHELAESALTKAILQHPRIAKIKEGYVTFLFDNDSKKISPLIGTSDVLALQANGLMVGAYVLQSINSLASGSQILVVVVNAFKCLRDDFMVRANCIHEAMWLLNQGSEKSTIVVMEEKVDENSLRQIMHFAGCKHIEKMEVDVPGVVLIASCME